MKQFIDYTNKILSGYGFAARRVDSSTIEICGRNINLYGTLDKFKEEILTVIHEKFQGYPPPYPIVCKNIVELNNLQDVLSKNNSYPMVYKKILEGLFWLKVRKFDKGEEGPLRGYVFRNNQTTYRCDSAFIIRNVDIPVKDKIYGNGNNAEALINLIEKDFRITRYEVEFQYSISSIKVLKGKHPNVDPVTKKFHWSVFKKTPNVILSIDTFKRIEEEMAVADFRDYYMW